MRTYPGAGEIVTLTDAGSERVSHGALVERVDRLARALRALGVARGERVGTFAWNSQRHLECYFAIPCIGAVLHTINLRLFPEQIAYVINHAEDGSSSSTTRSRRCSRRLRRRSSTWSTSS
jgi:fatty-acyl-CoA synthase